MLLISLLTIAVTCPVPEPPVPAPLDFQAHYEAGLTFEAFLAGVESRREDWQTNYDAARIPSDAAATAARIPGSWRLLVVTADWCGDSVNSIPYLARLVETSDNIEMRIVDREQATELLEAYPTPDGRPATPTIFVLNPDYTEVGCWIERPSPLRDWALERRGTMPQNEFHRRLLSWYAWDRGETSVREIVDLVAAAAAGRPHCAAHHEAP